MMNRGGHGAKITKAPQRFQNLITSGCMEVKHSVETDMLLIPPFLYRTNKCSKYWTYEIISAVDRRCAVSIILASSVDLKSENNRGLRS